MEWNALTRRGFLKGSTALGLVAAARPKSAWSAEDGVLRLRYNRDLDVLDPGYMVGGIEINLQYACLAQLTNYSPGEKWAWQPSYFVESIEQADPTHITFRLRPGTMWSNDFGELTTEDVKYSFERMTESQWKDKFGSLDRVEIVDKYNGVVVLKEPFAPLWYTTLCDGTGSIVCKKAVEAVGGKYTSEFPATCGPYVIKKWTPKQRVDLALNPLWNGPKPEFEEVHIIIVENDKTAELAYEAGEFDLTAISVESLPRYRKELPPNTNLVEAPGLLWSWMGMNTEHPKLSDIRVRRAIQHTVDVDSILLAAYGGIAARSRGIVPPRLIGHRTHTAFEKPDLDKARSLMAEAGVSSLSLELKTLNQTDRLSAAQVIQANLAEIGIEVEIIPLDPGPFWNLGLEAEGDDWKDLQLWIMRYGDTADPSQMAQWYISDQVGIWNWERWRDQEFDDLFQKGLIETDEEKRHEIYVRMQDIMEETGAYVWIAHESFPVIYKDHFIPVIYPDGWRIFLPWFKRA